MNDKIIVPLNIERYKDAKGVFDMLKKELVNKIIKMRNLLLILFATIFVLAVGLVMFFDGSPYLDVVMVAFVLCGVIAIITFGALYIGSMNKCSCPHCGEGKKFRFDEYFSRLLKSYSEGKSFECPKCHMLVDLE